MSIGRAVALKRTQQLFKNWDPEVPYLDQITFLGSNIIGEAGLGIPNLELKYAKPLRKLGQSLANCYKHPSTVNPMAGFIHHLNKVIVEEQGDKILAANRFIKKDFDIYAHPNKALTTELFKRRPASWYATESALSAVLGMGLAQLSVNDEVREQLKVEIKTFKHAHALDSDDCISDEELFRPSTSFRQCLVRNFTFQLNFFYHREKNF